MSLARGEQRFVSQFVADLKRCSKTRDLERGKKLHREAIAANFHTNKHVASVLITMYGKCRSMPLARQVFDGLTHRDVVTWNSLIMGYVENGQSLVALDLFSSMDCQPSCITYVAALKACGSLASEKVSERQSCLEKGAAVHEKVRELGLDSDLQLATTLVDMYGKCGGMNSAKKVFDGMPTRSVVTWNSLIMGYVENEDFLAALEVFTSMDIQPDSLSYVAAIKACSGLASGRDFDRHVGLEKGVAIHKELRNQGFGSDIVVATTLVDMYGKCRSMQLGREVFDGMKTRNVVTWTSLMLGYVGNGEYLNALELVSRMDCHPNLVTYVAILKAYGGLASERESEKEFCLEKVINTHKEIRNRGYDSSLAAATTLVDTYSKCGSMSQAEQVFDGMKSRDVVAWNSFIQGYVVNGEHARALELFARMDCEPDSFTYVSVIRAYGGLASEKSTSDKQQLHEQALAIHKEVEDRGFSSDRVIATALVELYSKCGSVEHARKLFDKMATKDVCTWTSLIVGYVENGRSSEAMDLFARMDCEPDPLTYVAALKACGSSTALSTGKRIQARVCKLGLEQVQVVANSLMNFYVRCGRTSSAAELFNSLGCRDMFSWNILIAGYSTLGDSLRVSELVEQMNRLDLQLDGVTFTSILTACSHAGLVEEGKRYLESMQSYGISPQVDHFNCVIDMLGRANRLQEALALVHSMPFEADSVTWRTLLGACRKWKNLEVGKVAYDALVRIGDTDSAAAYVLMSDLYANVRVTEETTCETDAKR